MLIKIMKGTLLIFWLVFIYSLFQPFSKDVQLIVFWSGIILIIAHILEYLLKRKELEAANAGGVNGVIQTFLFGAVYWFPVLKKQKNK